MSAEMSGKHLHFIGIGGSSMSGLARFMLQKGCAVSGSDRDASHKTEALEKLGVKIYIGHSAENVHGADLVVYSAAIAESNPERAEAKRLGIPQVERAVLLGRLMSTFDQAICVSGTHGKTTTTSMIAQIFVEAGEDPGVHIGGELDAIGGGTRVGGGNTFIAEACEYSGSFWHFYPTIAVILNIDEDHLDFYKDLDDIEASFRRFAGLVPEDGWVVGWGDDPRVRHVLSALKCRTRTYGLEPYNELRAEDISYDELGRPRFTVTLYGHPLCEVELAVSGEKNLLDALAAIAVSDIAELPMSRVSETLAHFTGAHRRFDLTSVTDGVRIYQDYAHNPAEMKTAIHIAAMQPHKTLWAVWQPHTYSRTKALFNGFVETFDEADHILITDVMGARESDPGDIRSEMFLEPLRARGKRVDVTPTFDDAEAYLRSHWHSGDLVITLGCGNIDLLNEQIAKKGDTKQ
ncbi:MAG: UDP-N-acetylmuramate--L-alanine ligase [Clostridiales bacterium]|nr:UDP-N-acetylmuramate--L-alanine ligase [Clostridiales bacterium]MDY2873269.1 UDP-N-acetylmuramate--L-alanine ligase [Eubacteriales bacterium]